MFRICKPLFFCFHTGLFINIMYRFFFISMDSRTP
jgi:hypothetical protein